MSRLLRVLQTTQVTLSHTFVADGVPTDAAGDVTYTLKRLDGTAVINGTATHPGGAGLYRFVLPQAQTNALDAYTLDWVGSFGGAAVRVRDFVEVVGGWLFSLSDARSMPPSLSAVTYPDAMLAAKRTTVELACEQITNVSHVPRFKRFTLNGRGGPGLATPVLFLRAVRAMTVNGTVYTSDQLTALGYNDAGVITMNSQGLPYGCWPYGQGNIVVEVEYGQDYPPEDLAEAAIVHMRSRLTAGDTSVPYRAISFTSTEGGVYRLSTPGKRRTGIPFVDAAYEANSIEMGP